MLRASAVGAHEATIRVHGEESISLVQPALRTLAKRPVLVASGRHDLATILIENGHSTLLNATVTDIPDLTTMLVKIGLDFIGLVHQATRVAPSLPKALLRRWNLLGRGAWVTG